MHTSAGAVTGAAATTGAAPGPAGRPDGPGDVLDGARRTLAEAHGLADPVARYHRAHLAAVRGAVAATGLLARPTAAPAPQRTVWSLLAERAPELTEWAWFLASTAPLTLATTGRGHVGERDADDLLRQVAQFLDLLAAPLRRACRDLSAAAVRTTVDAHGRPGGDPRRPGTTGGRT
ncbi:SAV_6107 family HEPN domain-containing protein [Rhodococcus aerolatus]